VLGSSLLGKAQKNGLVSYHLTQIRDFASDKHRTVDDTPYGGGEGMLLKADVLYAAWESAVRPIQNPESQESPELQESKEKVATLLLSPQGALFTQDIA